jgi:hypothetical protein
MMLIEMPMGTFEAAIIGTRPREKAGARTGARFAFQAHVSLVKVLDLHVTGADYRAIFDHFDDLMIISPSGTAQQADFYQIKGQEAPWTAAKLCAAKGQKPQTTIGKMYFHSESFAGLLGSAVFVTNAPFRFDLAGGRKSTPDHRVISYADIGAPDLKVFETALDLDFPAPRSPSESEFIRFERSDVPLRGYDRYLQGRLVEFFAGEIGVPIDAVYRTLIADLTGKANDTDEYATLADLYRRKSLSRADMESVFSAAVRRRDVIDDWSVIDEELRASGRSTVDRIRLKTAVVEYSAARSKRLPQATALATAIRQATGLVGQQLASASTVLAACGLVAGRVPPGAGHPVTGLMLEAALLTETFEALNG